MMRNILRILIIILVSVFLSSCAKMIARRIQKAESMVDKDYPPAFTSYKELKKTVNIKLNRYKSVETRRFQRKDIAFALAVSGGGYRAANLTVGVLEGLEKIHTRGLRGNLLQEIDYYSSVSGGGIGVGFYLTKLRNYLESHKNIKMFSLRESIDAMLSDDAIKPNPLRANLMPYLFSNRKKALELEKILNDTLLWTSTGGLKEGDIFVPANSRKNVQLPYWAMNSTIYQNAAIFPFTPDVLSAYRIRGFYHNNQYCVLRGSFSNLTYAYQMPISVGLVASMTVPFALPATTLVSQACSWPYYHDCYLQLFDGGVADNLGVNTALDLLSQDKEKIKILMVVDAGKDLLQPFSYFGKSPAGASFLARLSSISLDAYRKHLKSHLSSLAHKLLCAHGANNVIVIYLDLEDYPDTQDIPGQLEMTAEQQKMLLHIGKQLVLRDKELQETLSQISRGHLTLGACH